MVYYFLGLSFIPATLVTTVTFIESQIRDVLQALSKEKYLTEKVELPLTESMLS